MMTSVNGLGMSYPSELGLPDAEIGDLAEQWAPRCTLHAPDDTRSRFGQVEVCRTVTRRKQASCSELEAVAQFSK